MHFSTVAEVNQYLGRFYITTDDSKYAFDPMTRMEPLLRIVGNPQNAACVIHVAGTSGKTSTCYYIAELLRASGKAVGLTVSPYVDTVRERIQIHGQPMSEIEFCEEMGEFLELIQSVEYVPGYLEVMIAFALWSFKRHKVDYVVMETFVGGLHDSTNIVTRQDKVCVITDIGMDHMRVLGNTLQDIAAQKAGIIHNKNDIFIYEQSDEVMNVMRVRATDKHANLHVVGVSQDRFVQLPLYQQRNLHLAYSVVSFIAHRDVFSLAEVRLDRVASDTVIPGRMEIKKGLDGTYLILDGAHNAQKMQAFVESFMELFPGVKASVLAAFKQDKQYPEMLEILKPVTKELIVTTLNSPKDTAGHSYHMMSAPPQTAAGMATAIGMNARAINDPASAFAELMKSTQHIRIVTGSLYLIGIIHALEDQK